MSGKIKIRSIILAAVVFLGAGCGRQSGEAPRAEPAAELRATPAAAGTLSRYREKGIEPRRARFSRELEE